MSLPFQVTKPISVKQLILRWELRLDEILKIVRSEWSNIRLYKAIHVQVVNPVSGEVIVMSTQRSVIPTSMPDENDSNIDKYYFDGTDIERVENIYSDKLLKHGSKKHSADFQICRVEAEKTISDNSVSTSGMETPAKLDWKDVQISYLTDEQTISIVACGLRKDYTFDIAGMDNNGKPSRSWTLLVAFLAQGGTIYLKEWDTPREDLQTQVSRLRKRLAKILPHAAGESITYVKDKYLNGGYKTNFISLRPCACESVTSRKAQEISEEVFNGETEGYTGRVIHRNNDKDE